MVVVATLKDGRVIARGATSSVVAAATDPNPINVTLPDLRSVEYVLTVNLKTTPDTTWDTYPSRNLKITGNIVGLTLGSTAAGTTITAEVIGVGF